MTGHFFPSVIVDHYYLCYSLEFINLMLDQLVAFPETQVFIIFAMSECQTFNLYASLIKALFSL